eukprot:gnl/Ergobibamus_cyprinoides/671.p1 GENE.gnl/Ergobibamus_cyprinoides/671~~gnl/Ergobibamus_cyprinoides/671.p1  ORF type:complete len:291 (+),score=127.60 gnl/Ergobibamus_cyprinoides/671:34-873(+)
MTVDPIRRVGIICAITREIELLKDAVIDAAVQKVAGRDFISGTLSGVPVVLCLSGVGKVAAAVTTSIMADRFRIASILFIGVAGALGDGIKVGDIVIATHLLQHDVDVRPFYEQYVLPMPHSIARLPVVDSLVEAAARACAQYIGAEMHDDISEDLFAHFGMSSQGPTVHRGLIVSGDQFVSSSEVRDRIIGGVPDAMCCEMEGAAVAQAAKEFAVPCCVVRVMSDSADGSAHVDFDAFCNKVSAVFLLGLTKILLASKAPLVAETPITASAEVTASPL